MILNSIIPSQLDFENNPPEVVDLLKSRNSGLYSKLLDVYRKVRDILDTRVSQVFPDYTLHNMGHSLRIMNYMGHIVHDLSVLGDLELAMLIYSALLHDIGMGATNEEVNQIKLGILQYKSLKYDAILKRSGDHTIAIQDYIRRVHAIRSAHYVNSEIKDLLVIPEMPTTSFANEVANICQAHQEDITWIHKNLDSYGQKGIYVYNGVFCAMVLRIADLLDFDSERTPPNLFKVLNPRGISKVEWQQHFTIDNSNKILVNIESGQKEIVLYGKCNNSNIHRKVLKYIDWINEEIENINLITKSMDSNYRINFIPKVNNNIKSEGYTFADLRFNVNFKQVTRLLMGEQIYGAKKFGLRELIQNSIDACKTRKEIEDSNTAYGYDEYRPVIKILLDKCKDEVTIIDNGTGMTIEILKNFFLNVGSSYYTSDDFQLQGLKHKPIGNYGIGFSMLYVI
jgi:molecular chaperone HtpG